MALELRGRVIGKTEIERGESARGPWQKRYLIIEQDDTFRRRLALVAWGELAQALDNLSIGQEVKVIFNIESREHNGRWYTDARLVSVKIFKEESIGISPDGQGPGTPTTPADIEQEIDQMFEQHPTATGEQGQTTEQDEWTDVATDLTEADDITQEEPPEDLIGSENEDDDLPF